MRFSYGDAFDDQVAGLKAQAAAVSQEAQDLGDEARNAGDALARQNAAWDLANAQKATTSAAQGGQSSSGDLLAYAAVAGILILFVGARK